MTTVAVVMMMMTAEWEVSRLVVSMGILISAAVETVAITIGPLFYINFSGLTALYMQFLHTIVKCNRTDLAEYNTEHDLHDSVYSAQCAVEKTQRRAKIIKCGFY